MVVPTVLWLHVKRPGHHRTFVLAVVVVIVDGSSVSRFVVYFVKFLRHFLLQGLMWRIVFPL